MDFAPVPEPIDEKTPVSTYDLHCQIRAPEQGLPGPAVVRLSHVPMRPVTGVPSGPNHEPRVVIVSTDGAEIAVDSQPETLFMVRRRYARVLQLTLLAGIGAFLTATLVILLARGAPRKNCAAVGHAGTSASNRSIE
jgi:hypothetical protein